MKTFNIKVTNQFGESRFVASLIPRSRGYSISIQQKAMKFTEEQAQRAIARFKELQRDFDPRIQATFEIVPVID